MIIRPLALSADEITQKLENVPVFVIINQKGALFIEENNKIPVFFKPEDAQTKINNLVPLNLEQIPANLKVASVPLSDINLLAIANKDNPNALEIEYIPDQKDVNFAIDILQRQGQQITDFQGVPIFLLKAGIPEDYLTVELTDPKQTVIPAFLAAERRRNTIQQFADKNSVLLPTVKVEVSELSSLINNFTDSDNNQFFNDLVLFPSQTSLDFAANNSLIIPNPDRFNFWRNFVNKVNEGIKNQRVLSLTPQDDIYQVIAGTIFSQPGGILGLEGNDILTGSSDNDAINGNAGDDRIIDTGGHNFLRGGKGNDQIITAMGNDLISGGEGNDNLEGKAGDDWLRGGKGEDTLIGGSGNDFLLGDKDLDLLTGGDGADTFILKIDPESRLTDVNLVDKITDFSGDDRLIIAGQLGLTQISFTVVGKDTIIQQENGNILGVVLNSEPLLVQVATSILPQTDPALYFG